MADIIEYFNTSLTKSMATVDKKGKPNICLCGSATMINEETIHAVYGYFDTSYSNLQNNQNCVFLVSKALSKEFWQHFEQTGEKLYSPGYRVFCRFIEEVSDVGRFQEIRNRIQKSAGNRVASNLKKLLIFEVEEIKEIRF